MEKKIIREITIYEADTKEGRGFGFNIDGDLTPNQLMCMCAWVLINALRDTNCGEDEYIDTADRIKRMILDNDEHFIKYCYMKACKDAENEVGK